MLAKYGEWALVTGASSGIGKAFAFDIASKGVNVFLVSNEEKELKEICSQIAKKHNVKAEFCAVDLSNMYCHKKVKTCVANKEIGMLVNNASYGIHGKFIEIPLESYQNMMKVNMNAYVALTHAFLPAMIERKKGAVIMVSSLNSFSPIAESSIYTASKAFELYFGCSLWEEMKEHNVDVLNIMPGPTKTGFQERAETKVNSMALSPEELVAGVWPCLGIKMTYVPGIFNKLISFIGSNIEMEKRVQLASKIYKLMLHDKPEANLIQLLAELDFL